MAPQDDIVRLFDKLEELNEKLTAHVAWEEGYHASFKEKLDTHVAEAKASSERWAQGWVGLVFAVIGAAILGLWEWLRSQGKA